MGTFFKTFIICLIICLSFFIYKFVISESHSPNLSVSKENPVFSSYNKFEDNLKENKKQTPETLPVEDKINSDEIPTPKNKFVYTCYFYSTGGKLIPVKREFSIEQNLENNIKMLLKGPTILEEKQGIYSEIPKGVDLISSKSDNDSVIINLTSKFGQGGGSQSIENRLKQLSKTVKSRAKGKKVYLYIDNKEVEYLGGEGIYVKQPLD